MPCKKRKTKKRKTTKQIREDTQQRRKYKKGGRIEAYTFGDAQKGKGFPW